MTAAPPDRVETRSDDEASEPGVEALRVAQTRQALPGPDKALLDRVPRELVVPENQAGCRIQPRDGGAGKRGEGVMIAPLRPLDELPLVHGIPR